MSIRANAISLKAARAFSDAIQDRVGLAAAHDQAQPCRCLARGRDRGRSALSACSHRARVEAHQLVVVLNGLFVQAEFRPRQTALEVGCRIVRVEADRPVVVGDGFLVASQAVSRVAVRSTGRPRAISGRATALSSVGLPARARAGQHPFDAVACPARALGRMPETLAARATAASTVRVARLLQLVIVPRVAPLKRRPGRRARVARAPCPRGPSMPLECARTARASA